MLFYRLLTSVSFSQMFSFIFFATLALFENILLKFCVIRKGVIWKIRLENFHVIPISQ